MSNTYPKLHNAGWPDVVGKGPDSEPPIGLDNMLEMMAAAEVDGTKFDGIDLFYFDLDSESTTIPGTWPSRAMRL